MHEEFTAAAEKFVRSLRKPAKREYAAAYLAWFRKRFSLTPNEVMTYAFEEPIRGDLSYMGAQAVRNELHLIASLYTQQAKER